MLGLVALSLLLIASTAIAQASSAQTTLSERRILQLQVEELGYYADQICVLGEGNARVVALSPMEMQMGYEEGNLSMSNGKQTYSRAMLCPVVVDLDGYNHQAYLRFERDASSGRPIVRIANQPEP